MSVEQLNPAKADHMRDHSDDRELWLRFKSGAEDAYAVIYQQQFFALYDYGMKICRDRDVVKDCIQDLFIHIWNNRERLADVDSIKYYLLRALKSRLINYHTRASHQHTLAFDDDLSWMDSSLSPEQKLIDDQLTHEQQDSIHKALEKLTVRQKEAIILKFYKNMPSDEIASAMSISVEAVYNTVYKALGRLKADIGRAYVLLLFIWSFFTA